MRVIFFTIMTSLFVACSSVNYDINDTQYIAQGKNERIKFIIIHYTATDSDEVSIRTLTKGDVSSHFLITTVNKDPIFKLVPLTERAWHSGVSSFDARTNVNDTSIGIEIVNKGVENYDESLMNYGFFIPRDKYVNYSDGQIKKLATLLKQLIKQYNVNPKYILGHSDVAPLRKVDPGPKFPWEKLYDEYGIGAWYNEMDKYEFMNEELFQKTTILEIKEEFRKYGYDMNDTPEWDEESRRVIYNFQAHFNQDDISGNMDLRTFAILKALNKKYR